jgi:hypothetical protein
MFRMLLSKRTFAVVAGALLISSALSACIVVPARRYRVVVVEAVTQPAGTATTAAPAQANA